MNKQERQKMIDNFYEARQGFLINFYGGPLDGVEAWASEIAEALAIPVNPEMIDHPFRPTPTDSKLPPTSVTHYQFQEYNGRFFYVFDRAIKPKP